jgi:hypothetical protein
MYLLFPPPYFYEFQENKNCWLHSTAGLSLRQHGSRKDNTIILRKQSTWRPQRQHNYFNKRTTDNKHNIGRSTCLAHGWQHHMQKIGITEQQLMEESIL